MKTSRTNSSNNIWGAISELHLTFLSPNWKLEKAFRILRSTLIFERDNVSTYTLVFWILFPCLQGLFMLSKSFLRKIYTHFKGKNLIFPSNTLLNWKKTMLNLMKGNLFLSLEFFIWIRSRLLLFNIMLTSIIRRHLFCLIDNYMVIKKWRDRLECSSWDLNIGLNILKDFFNLSAFHFQDHLSSY